MPKIPWWAWALGLGTVAYLLYRSVASVGTAVSAVTAPIASTIASIWDSLPLVGIGPGMTVLGSVALPNGTLYPLSSLQSGQIRSNTDSSGNYSVYANVQGNIYQLSASNAQGNYPATLIGPAPAGS